MSAALITEALDLAAEIQTAMDRAEQEQRIPESVERWCALRNAQTDVRAAAGQVVMTFAVFGSGEPEYRDAEKVLRDELPAAMERARRVLQQEVA